jgi:hypothetical protein
MALQKRTNFTYFLDLYLNKVISDKRIWNGWKVERLGVNFVDLETNNLFVYIYLKEKPCIWLKMTSESNMRKIEKRMKKELGLDLDIRISQYLKIKEDE